MEVYNIFQPFILDYSQLHPLQIGYVSFIPPQSGIEYSQLVYSPAAIVSNQPIGQSTELFSDAWMSMPQSTVSYPPGLEYPTLIDQWLVYPKVQILEAFTKFESTTQVTIK